MKWKIVIIALFVTSAAGATGYYANSTTEEHKKTAPPAAEEVAKDLPETEASTEPEQVAAEEKTSETEPVTAESEEATENEALEKTGGVVLVTIKPTSPLVALKPTMTLSGKADGTAVNLSWTVTGITGGAGFKVVMSTDPNPVYPGDEYLYLSDPATRNATWKGLPAGTTLHFRVCEYLGGKCGVYSNDITIKTGVALTLTKELPKIALPAYITVPGELSLTVSDLTSGVALAWTPRTPKAFTGYKVVRSETDSDPYYPKSGYRAFITDSSATQWTDTEAVVGKTYYYRICSLTSDGSPMACGNVVKFTVK